MGMLQAMRKRQAVTRIKSEPGIKIENGRMKRPMSARWVAKEEHDAMLAQMRKDNYGDANSVQTYYVPRRSPCTKRSDAARKRRKQFKGFKVPGYDAPDLKAERERRAIKRRNRKPRQPGNKSKLLVKRGPCSNSETPTKDPWFCISGDLHDGTLYSGSRCFRCYRKHDRARKR